MTPVPYDFLVSDEPLVPGSFGLRVEGGALHVPIELVEKVVQNVDINRLMTEPPHHIFGYLSDAIATQGAIALGWSEEQWRTAVEEAHTTIPEEWQHDPHPGRGFSTFGMVDGPDPFAKLRRLPKAP